MSIIGPFPTFFKDIETAPEIGDKGTFPEKVTLGKRSFMDKVSSQTYKNRLMTDEEIEEYKKPVPLEVE